MERLMEEAVAKAFVLLMLCVTLAGCGKGEVIMAPIYTGSISINTDRLNTVFYVINNQENTSIGDEYQMIPGSDRRRVRNVIDGRRAQPTDGKPYHFYTGTNILLVDCHTHFVRRLVRVDPGSTQNINIECSKTEEN